MKMETFGSSLVVLCVILLAALGPTKAYPTPIDKGAARSTAEQECRSEDSLSVTKAQIRPLSDDDEVIMSQWGRYKDTQSGAAALSTVLHINTASEKLLFRLLSSRDARPPRAVLLCPGGVSGAGGQGDDAGVSSQAGGAVVVAPAAVGGGGVKPTETLFVALTEPGFALLNRYGNISVVYSCDHTHYHCLNIKLTEHLSSSSKHTADQRVRRRAAHMTSEGGSHEPGSQGYRKAVLGVVLAVVGVVCLGAVLALCGSSQTYETVKVPSGVQVQPIGSEVPQPSVATASPTDTHNANIELKGDQQQTNGALARNQITLEDSTRSTSSKGASFKGNDEMTDSSASKSAEIDQQQSGEEARKRSNRARTLSAKSQEPLPELPPEDQAEGGKKEEEERANYDEEESQYDYALVPGEERMKGSDSEPEEGEGNGDQERPVQKETDKASAAAAASGSGLPPPYGKVTKHRAASVPREDDDYTEVRNFDTKPAFQVRERSVTAPVDPSQVGVAIAAAARDKRTFTESATHLPLPAIPRGGRPPHVAATAATGATAAAAVTESVVPMPQQETLYESVDELKDEPEDMYESVPDTLKPGNSSGLPPLLCPMSPPTPTMPLKSPGNASFFPLPPASPIPSKAQHREREVFEKEAKAEILKEKDKGKRGKEHKKKKKELGKTVSAAETTDSDGKRRFSFLNRKKTQSVSAVNAKQKKGKSVVDSPSPINTSPTTVSPTSHPPNIPAPSPPLLEDNDDTYDRPLLDDMYDRPLLGEDFQGRTQSESDDSPVKKPMSIEEAKKKSQSLPSSMRMGPVSISRPNIPLPELPEDSGSGTVTVVHQKNEEVEGGLSYDVVVHGNPQDGICDDDEPNYDSVHLPLVQNVALAAPNQEDPGYDSVKNLLAQQQNGAAVAALLQQEQGEGNEAEPQPAVVAAATGMQYGKVVHRASDIEPGMEPEHDESGYAVVPDEIKMRKRALSASKGVKQQVSFELEYPEFEDPGYDKVSKLRSHGPDTVKSKQSSVPKQVSFETPEAEFEDPGYDVVSKPKDRAAANRRASTESEKPSSSQAVPPTTQEPQKPAEDEQYAEIDMVAKRLSQRKRKDRKSESLSPRRSSGGGQPKSPSPIPPPVPAAGDLGILGGEFDLPPIPVQSAGVHQLMVDDEPGPGYSRLNQLAVNGSSNDPPYAKVSGDHPYATLENPNGDEESYTTVTGDKAKSKGAPTRRDKPFSNGSTETQARSTLEQEMPKLDLAAAPIGPMYDILESPQAETVNIYDSLEPQAGTVKPSQPTRDADYEDIDYQEGYEEIDENTRRDLIQKFNS